MAEFVKQIHEKARLNIERKMEQYARQANKGRQKLIFEPEDWVWLHIRKERFPAQRHSKLLPRGDEPFQVLSISMTMPTNYIYLVSVMLILLLMLLTYLLLM